MSILVTDFSGTYAAQGFLPWLQEQAGEGLVYRDFTGLEGTCCYCDAQKEINEGLPAELPRLRFIDSGDYHYMSHLLGGVLSCGSWVSAMQQENPQLRSVLTVGPEGCPESLPEGWLEQRRGERVYVSLDKDILDRSWARTDWSQGTHTLEQVQDLLTRILEAASVVAVDICGELSPSKGGGPEDLRINYETNKALYTHVIKHL